MNRLLSFYLSLWIALSPLVRADDNSAAIDFGNLLADQSQLGTPKSSSVTEASHNNDDLYFQNLERRDNALFGTSFNSLKSEKSDLYFEMERFYERAATHRSPPTPPQPKMISTGASSKNSPTLRQGIERFVPSFTPTNPQLKEEPKDPKQMGAREMTTPGCGRSPPRHDAKSRAPGAHERERPVSWLGWQRSRRSRRRPLKS